MYSARITRGNPSAFVILIDQSGSMEEKIPFCGQLVSKASAVAALTNDLITELINRSRREDGVGDYFDLAVYGYGGQGILPMLGSRGGFVGLSQVATLDVRVKEVTVERTLAQGQKFMTTTRNKLWVKPIAQGGTPMLKALDVTYRLLSKWCSKPEHATAYPPIVFNITDGEASDGDEAKLLDMARKITDLATDDGNVLLFNTHIANAGADRPLVFPTSKDELPNHCSASLLYHMSSVLPLAYSQAVYGEDVECRAMSYNAGIAEVLTMMDIGSITVNNLG